MSESPGTEAGKVTCMVPGEVGPSSSRFFPSLQLIWLRNCLEQWHEHPGLVLPNQKAMWDRDQDPTDEDQEVMSCISPVAGLGIESEQEMIQKSWCLKILPCGYWNICNKYCLRSVMWFTTTICTPPHSTWEDEQVDVISIENWMIGIIRWVHWSWAGMGCYYIRSSYE